MSSDEKIMEEGGEGSSQDTPQAITITIMDPSALETTTLDSALVASVEAQDPRQGDGSLLVVPGDSNGSISVAHGAKNILQTVTETHLGAEDLPVISNINSSEDTSEQSTIHLVTKTNDGLGVKVDEVDECEISDFSGHQCLICDEELQDEQIPVFKTQTATSQRKVSVFLGVLVGQKITSRKAHSDIICQKCFGLLNKLDLLEVEIRSTKDEIVNKYQETVSVHGGRARRKKSAAAKKSEYVFPKIEPEDEDEQALALEMDETFEPHVDDLMEEEHDRREDRDSQDEEWEPEFKKARIKREPSDNDPNGPPKRKRGRPRKDASKPKTPGEEDHVAEIDNTRKELSGENRLSRPGALKTSSCAYCEEEIPVLQLMSHLDTHEHQQLSCPFCSQGLPRVSLCRHIQEQHADCLYECDICNIKFANSSSFNRHYETHITGELSCDHCNVKFSSSVELVNHNHLRHMDKTDERYTCQACGKSYSHRAKFITHVVKLHREKVEIDGLQWDARGYLVCQICQKKFKKASLYISHEKVHKNQRFYCPYCRSSYPSVTLLQDHVLSHEFGDYECNECVFKFSSLKQLNVHKERIHNIEVSKICEYCNKEFKETIHLICHRRKEHPESIEAQKAKYSCGECGMKFLVRGNLVRHLKMHENRKHAKTHECDICGKVLRNKYSLATHIKSHSRGSYKCNACDKLFVSKYTLLDHIRRIHDDIGYGRDKVCKQCGRSFFTKSELEYHIKTHTGERPYRCEICGETYLTTSTLRYHMQKHSNTMFVCQVCNSKFKNYVGWSAHVKRVHGVTCVREYTKEHGIMKTVVEKDAPSLYIVAPEHTRSVDGVNNLVTKDMMSESLNSTSLAVGLEETVVSMPGKEVDNIVHVVSYDDLANPLVHTVDAAEVPLPDGNPTKTGIAQSSVNFTSDVMKTKLGEEGDANYPQSSDRGRVMIPEGWELILSSENEESQVVVAEEWESAHIIVPETGEAQHMVLSNEWDGSQGMAELVVKEEDQQTHVVMSSWKDCVDYE